MRILIVGEGRFRIYEEAVAEQLSDLGHEATVLGWSQAFSQSPGGGRELPPYSSPLHRLEDRLATGPHHVGFNRSVVERVASTSPDAVLLFNAKHVRASTVEHLRRHHPTSLIVQYNNDNPFSPRASWWRWRHVRASVPHVHLSLAYRTSNLRDLQARGAKRVALWRSACTLEDLQLGASPQEKDIDVLFAGHFEDDGRVQALEHMLAAGIRLQVRGGGWQAWARTRRAQATQLAGLPLDPLFGADYRMSLARAKVALCFLSSLNQDTYTRRSFEIPAVGTAQLSQFSDDLASLFIEDREIVFFRDPDEMLEKAQRLLADAAWRDSVALGGRERVISEGHDIRSRAAQLVHEMEAAREERAGR